MEETRRRSKAVWITSIAFAAVILAATAGGRWILGRQGQEPQPVSLPSTSPVGLSTSPSSPSPYAGYSESGLPAEGSETLCSSDQADVASCVEKVQEPGAEQASVPETLTPASLNQEISLETPGVDLPVRRTAPVVGGADKVAFLNEEEVWAVNVDGSALEQLTRDGFPKSNLQWSLDGNSVYFLSGSCIQSTGPASFEAHPVLCLDGAGQLTAFQFSPGEDRLALVLDRALYLIRNDPEKLIEVKMASDLQANAACPSMAPYALAGRVVPVKSARWSQDGGQLAIVRPALDDGRLVDLVHMLDLAGCESYVRRLDEFPGKRFSMSGYDTTPVLQNIAWDGWKLFALISYRRNKGFGDLWIYNRELYRADLVNPVEGACCYRDPFFSPDGSYLLFAFQDKRLAPGSEVRLYYVPLATVGTGLAYAPIPLPDDFFPDPHSRPQPVLRTAK